MDEKESWSGLSNVDRDDPLTLGALVKRRDGIFQLDYVVNCNSESDMGSSGITSGNASPLFILAKDLDRFASSLITESYDDSISLVSPTQPPHLLNLLPEPTLMPTMTRWTTICETLHGPRDCHMLLTGSSGSGKTTSAKLIATVARFKFQASAVYYDCRQQKDDATQLEQLLESLTQLFTSARSSQSPCLVILDDLDEICPNLQGSNGISSSSQAFEQTSPAEMEQVKAIGDHLRNLVSPSDKLSIVVTCRDVNSVEWMFAARQQYVRHRIALPVMTTQDKVDFLQKLIRVDDGLYGKDDTSVPNLDGGMTSSPGALPLEFRLRDLLPKDIEMVASRCLKRRNADPSPSNPISTIQEELESYIPLSRRSASEEPRESFPDWNTSIGGLFDAKKALVDLVVRPIKFRQIYETARIRLPKGILLFGPPGCGKTVLPASLAREVGIPLIVCRGPEILDKYMGASEAKVRALFERANLSAPSILFLDEIDSLAPHRGSDLTGVTDRVVNQLLTFLDGVEDSSAGKTVYVIGSSSRPDKIDSALLRPGRLEKHIYVGPPSSRRELDDAWAKVATNYNLNPALEQSLIDGSFLENLSNSIPLAMTPADIKAVFDTAQIRVIREHIRANADESEGTPLISSDDLHHALRSSEMGLSEPERVRLQHIYDRFRHGKSRKQDVANSVQRVALK